jgi:hypothetical protein
MGTGGGKVGFIERRTGQIEHRTAYYQAIEVSTLYHVIALITNINFEQRLVAVAIASNSPNMK